MTDGWGGGLSAIAPGVPAELQAAVQASAWRLVAHAETCAPIKDRLHVEFSVVDDADPYAQAARLARLLTQLTAQELPRLRRSIRCEARTAERLARVPGGGRIDVPRTWSRRRRTRTPLLSIRTTQRIAHTPVNQVVATYLSRLQQLLTRLGGVELLPPEAQARDAAQIALRRFMASSPLARIEPLQLSALPRVRQAARRRQAEWRRVAGFIRWWAALEGIVVKALLDDAGARFADGAAFELAACAGILCAWHQAIEAGRVAPAGLRLTLQLSAGRWALQIDHDAGCLWVHARDLNWEAAQDLAGLMAVGHALVVPGSAPATGALMTIPARHLGDLACWSPLLDRLDTLLEAA